MTSCTNTELFFIIYDKTEKKKASPCDVFVFSLELKWPQTSAVVIAAADNVMWCFNHVSSDE